MTYIYERVCGNCELTWQDASAHSGCPRCEANELREANRRLMEMRRDYIRAFAEPMRDGETVPDFARRCIATLEAERDALACLNGKEPMNGSFADACGVLASEFRREQAARIAAQEERDQHDKARCEMKREVVELRRDLELAAGELRVPVPAPGTDMARLLSANVLMRRELADLREAAQNDAFDGAKFVGVFEVRGEKHLGYRHDGSDETITPMCASSYTYERGGAAPMLVILYKKDAPDEDDERELNGELASVEALQAILNDEKKKLLEREAVLQAERSRISQELARVESVTKGRRGA